MNEDIIRMAREAGFMLRAESVEGQSDWWECFDEEIERFAALIAAAEREACAKLADEQLMNTSALRSIPPMSSAAWSIATAIRARGQA